MSYLIAALVWCALVATSQAPPVNKQVVRTASTTKVTVAVNTPTPKPAEQPQPEIQTPTVETPPEPLPTYSNEGLMAAAGIAQSDYAAVDYIVSHESGWSTTAVNPSSGSCGLVQELPCGKSGCTFGDGVCQLRWATSYATERYGSWWGAQSYWLNNAWW